MHITKTEIKNFLSWGSFEDTTKKYYKSILYSFLGYSDGKLKESTVRQFLRDRYDNPRSRNTALQAFRSLSKELMVRIGPNEEDGEQKKHELGLIRNIKREKVKHTITKEALTVEELGELLPELDGLKYSAIWLIHYFGCRPRELTLIDEGNIDYDNNEIIFDTEKTKVQRKLYFDDHTSEQLKKLIDAGYGYDWLYKQFKAVESKANVDKFTPKCGRKFFETEMQRSLLASDMETVRVDILVDYMMGHTVSGDIAKTYTNVYGDIKQAMLDHHPMKGLE